MLTKTDLNKIRNVVHEEVDVIIDEKLDSKLEPIKKDLTDLKKDVKYLKKKVNRIDRTVSLIVINYDEGDIKLGKKIRRIEDHLGLSA